MKVSTILLTADQRQATSDPPLPPITKEQILHDELASLLIEKVYNLNTMVTVKLYILLFNNYLFPSLNMFPYVYTYNYIFNLLSLVV